MKTWMAEAVVAVVVCAMGVDFYVSMRTARAQVQAVREIKEVIAAKRRTMRIDAGRPSDKLLAMAKSDPEFVLAFVLLEEARSFPGVPAGLEEEVLALANSDCSRAALEMVRQAIYDGLTEAIAESAKKTGRKPDGDRIGWVNNNPSTAMAFLEWPLAERLDKKAEYVISYLKGTYRDEPYWYAPITLQQMQQYWWGKWPFEGEQAPVYKPANLPVRQQDLRPPKVEIPAKPDRHYSTERSKGILV